MFAAEPVGAADAFQSFQTGELSRHQVPPNTVADGLKTTLGTFHMHSLCVSPAPQSNSPSMCGCTCFHADNNNWPVIRDFVDGIVLVSDEEIVSTMKLMWERMKLVWTTLSLCLSRASVSTSVILLFS